MNEYAKNQSHLSDERWLGSWVNARHLRQENTIEYRRRFAESPINMLTLENFLDEEVAVKLADFLANEACYKTIYGLYSAGEKEPGHEQTVSFEEWKAAAEKDRFFKFDDFDGFRQGASMSGNLAAYLMFRNAFNDARFIKYLNLITGTKTEPQKTVLNAVSMGRGDYLRQHSDNDGKFQLAFVFYLSQNWQPNFGAELRLLDRSRNVFTVEPKFNNFVIFSVIQKTSHHVEPVSDVAADWKRRTMSGWLFQPTA